jgi:hypothetical protein
MTGLNFFIRAFAFLLPLVGAGGTLSGGALLSAVHHAYFAGHILFFADIWNQVFHPETPPPMSPAFFLGMHWAASLLIFFDQRKVEVRQNRNKQK